VIRTTDDILLSLRRTDKHYLGCGGGLIFAPPHPRWLDRPGFWDGIQLFMQIIQPVFTFAFVHPDGREIPLILHGRSWTPACLESTFAAGAIRVTERRVVLRRSVASEVIVENRGDQPLDAILAAWTAIPGDRIRDRGKCRPSGHGVVFHTSGIDAQLRPDEIEIAALLRMEPPPDSTFILETQRNRGSPNGPSWLATPIRDLIAGAPAHTSRLAAEPADGRSAIHIGLSRRLRLEPRTPLSLTLAFDVDHAEPALVGASRSADRDDPGAHLSSRPAHDGIEAQALTAQTSQPTHSAKAARSVGLSPSADPAAPANPACSPVASSRAAWVRYFDETPTLRSSDPFLERCFAYRWYGLRLNSLDPAGLYARPTCAEGTDFFHDAVSYSAWCHARELRWLPEPERARGTILTFLDRQRDDGSLPGILYVDGEHPSASYFADWGGSVLAVNEVHPDRAFLEDAWSPLCRYADHLDQTRDPDNTGLFRVLDPYETGQETMSRYIAVDAGSDRHHFDYRLDLFGIDITIYVYRLRRALAQIANAIGRNADAAVHDAAADRTAAAVRARMWDEEAGLFFDVDPRTGSRTAVRAAVCFYPWMTDIAGAGHLAGLEQNLFDPQSFWTPFPVPSTAVSDPTFDADGYWKGVRQNCPWNGRVWPMANSHVAEALALQATTLAPHLRGRAADFIMNIVRMMFFDGDPDRPNSFEHYSPMTGRPCDWRGLDDYQHSWINDLIIRWIVGFRPDADGFIIDRLPSDIEHIALDRLSFRGHRIDIEIDGPATLALVDGSPHRSSNGPLRVRLSP
jgi:Mannosylglycerate hydrolase MGH1-like glycoside hydrolase domain